MQLHLNHTVTRVSRMPGDPTKFSLAVLVDGEPGLFEGYDAVIVASPLETSSIIFDLGVDITADGTGRGRQQYSRLSAEQTEEEGMCRWVRCSGRLAPSDSEKVDGVQEPVSEEVEGLKQPANSDRTFQRTITTYVEGHLQPAFFGASHLPSDMVLFSNDDQSPVSAISPKLLLEDGSGQRRIYKVFSSLPLNSTLLSALFGEAALVVRAKGWQAYPRFSPPETFAPFRLAPGICYINTIENAASAMEMSAIGAINCALMVNAHISRAA